MPGIAKGTERLALRRPFFGPTSTKAGSRGEKSGPGKGGIEG